MTLENVLRSTARLLDLGRHAEVVEACRRALQAHPGQPRLWSNLASALGGLGRHEQALEAFARAVELAPDSHLLRFNYGLALYEAGRNEPALEQLAQSVRLDPDWAPARQLLGAAMHLDNDGPGAREQFAAAMRLAPDDMGLRYQAALAELPICPRDEDEIDAARQAWERRLQELEEAFDPGEPAHLASAMAGLARTPFYLAYGGRVDTGLQRRFGRHLCRVVQAALPEFAEVQAMPPPEADGRLRLGFATRYFEGHSVWKLPLRGWLEQLDRRRFRLFGYATAPCPGPPARELCDVYHGQGGSLAQLAARIRGDRLHALIFPEVGMDWRTYCLAGLRLAPLQLAGPGHPETTGLATVDGFLSSELMEPAGAQAHYTERLHALPNLGACNHPPAAAPRLGRRELQLPQNDVLLFSPQSLFKYLPRYDELFARIVQGAPGARIVFIRHESSRGVTRQLRKRVERHFRERGLDPWRHLIFLPRLHSRVFTSVCAACDVFLDNPGWSGNNTSLEAIWQGLPVVTMPTELMRGRHAAANLQMCGVSSTVCSSVDEYVRKAVELANDAGLRRLEAAALCETRRGAFGDRACVRGLEEVLLREIEARRG